MTRQRSSTTPLTLGAILLLILTTVAQAADEQIDLELAATYFAEAKELCQADGGQLWGESFCVPMLFIDPGTRAVVASEGDPDSVLEDRGGVFVGTWPAQFGIANTTQEWHGRKWCTLVWPLPQDDFQRARLMMHESFHYVQDRLGFPMIAPPNAHLDTPEGRYWLQLEWRALLAALRGAGSERREATEDALVFRRHRRTLFPEAATQENQMEMNEGLAEYTGQKLSGASPEDLIEYLGDDLVRQESLKSFIASFAYWSGPAYGLLLDLAATTWRPGLTADADLGALLQAAYAVRRPDDLESRASARSDAYDGTALMAAEQRRKASQDSLMADLQRRFVDGAVLILPLEQINIQYDPNSMIPFGDAGTVYPTLFLSDAWGRITVSNGALLSSDWTTLRVAAPVDLEARPLKGDGYDLELSDGWEIATGQRMGDYILRQK